MKKILLVDDESAPREVIRYFIESNSLPLQIVGEAEDGDEAYKMILQKHPDIVFLDIEMPGMNGLQLMEKVRKEEKDSVKFIIVTAYDSFSYAQQALRMQASDFLLKPVMYTQFCETMKNVVGYQYSDNAVFNELLEFINEHYTEDLRMEDCAKAVAMSESNVSRFFQKYLGMSFKTYHNNLRMQKVKELLDEGIAIKEAAAMTGFNNLNYFYRMFKQYYQITPKEYITQSK